MNAPARDKLLAAAVALAAQVDHDELSIARLCSAAGVGRHEFKAVFGELSRYFEALQLQFFDGLRTRMLKMTAGTAPGALRIKLASESYLAYCLESAGVLRWLLAARAHSAVRQPARQQIVNYGLLLGGELRAAHCAQADALSRLYLAMLNEVAGVELRAGERRPVYRHALWHFLDQACGATTRQALSAA
ncbi:hypothetical protein [Solimonas soli]|uniref:hypothetical protein n=1 Tax=Solimonas soli TaxID=413479 RepID=UPI00047F93F8|nr:hypothetical protein [Solimonas soli]